MADGSLGTTKRSSARRWGTLGVIAVFALAAFIALRACDDGADASVQAAKVGGQWFHLEVAADEAIRMKGLGQRTHIEEDGGMLFVFAAAQDPNRGGFVMRDCPVDIDIIYLDGAGRVGNWRGMKAEAPRAANEGKVGDMGGTPGSDPQRYEDRLKRYEPRYAYQFAIELKGGTIDSKLKGKLKEGDKIDLPIEALKKRAK